MSALDLDDTEQPMDPKLALAIEAAFRRVSLTTVEFVPAPSVWRESNPAGSVSGPKTARKAQIKMDLAERDGFRCAYCAKEFIDLDDATLDHVIPNSIVGHWKPWNLLLACEPCNNLKADQVPLVLLPMLCTLLNELAQLAQHKQARRQAQVPFGQGTSKAARKRAAKQRAETRSKAAFRRRLEFYDAMRALNGPHVRQAIEAAPVRIALTAGQSEA